MDREGSCYECGSPIDIDYHFCDAECRARYTRQRCGNDIQKMRRAVGLQTIKRKMLGIPGLNPRVKSKGVDE